MPHLKKWISLVALGLLVGCASLPPEAGTFQLESARSQPDDRHVQQVFSTPTPAPTTTLDPRISAKSNKLLDQAIREMTLAHKEVTTRLAKERDRNIVVFAVVDPYSGAQIPAKSLAAYKTQLDTIITLLDNALKNQVDAMNAKRNSDLKTANQEIVRAKTSWYRTRFMFEQQALNWRKQISVQYQKIVKERRKFR
jgi:hypothetical protein